MAAIETWGRFTNLERATGDCWEDYGFFGLSLFGAPGDDLIAWSERVSALRRPEVRVVRCGALREAGFEVAVELWVDDH